VTLIVAVGYQNGVVLGAESAATDLQSAIKQPVAKIKCIAGQPLLFACSGDGSVIQHIEDALDGFQTLATIKETRQALKGLLLPVLQQDYANHIGIQGKPAPLTTTLFAGVCGDYPFILEIDEQGSDTVYGDGLGAFTAIGSGKILAQALFSPHLKAGNLRSAAEAKALAYRVVDDSIKLAAMFLAPPICLHCVEVGRGTIPCVAAELQAIGDTCEVWREMEREVFSQALTRAEGASAPAPEAPPAPPEAANEAAPHGEATAAD